MMTDQSDSASRQDAITDAASADVRERPMFPGAISVSRYAEPMAGHDETDGAPEDLAAAVSHRKRR
jgi:hypothetical protein